MKILVTGANGFLGRGIVKKLNSFNVEVVANDFCTDLITCDVNKINADLFSVEDPYNFFEKPDILLHLSWRNGFEHSDESHINDLPKHKKFIEKMLSAGLRHIAIMGSVHEVGFFEGSVNEHTKCEPQSYYGISKNALRQITELLCKKYDCIFQWLRGFYIVNNDSHGNSIFCKIVQAVNEGKTEFPFTMGLNQFDFLDYDVFCDMVVRTVIQDNVNGIINICSGRPEKLADRVERFIKENNYNIKLKYGAFPDRPYDSKAIWGDSRKIEEIRNN